MQQIHLSEEELQETLARARQLSRVVHGTDSETAMEPYLRAGEEVGIPREALKQALSERLALTTPEFSVGDMVFAPSVDGHWYAAQILTLDGGRATVRFLKGSEHTCATADLRALALIPGRVLQVDWKDWGWCNAKVINHEPHTGKTEAEHFGERKKFTTDQLRLHPKQANPPTTTEEKSEVRIKAMLMRVALLAGGVGMALGWMLPHFLPWLR
jgi:hypothetical protein